MRAGGVPKVAGQEIFSAAQNGGNGRKKAGRLGISDQIPTARLGEADYGSHWTFESVCRSLKRLPLDYLQPAAAAEG